MSWHVRTLHTTHAGVPVERGIHQIAGAYISQDYWKAIILYGLNGATYRRPTRDAL